jgi:hypothetical protein
MSIACDRSEAPGLVQIQIPATKIEKGESFFWLMAQPVF